EHGRVECRAAATGALRWAVDLAQRGAPAPANVLGLLWVSDLDGDGEDDLLVAGGRSIDAVVALSGRDGRRLWTRATSGCTAALAEAGDLDGDGRHDLFAVGGSAAPFAAALSGDDGRELWSAPLPAPGSAVLRLDDVDGDGRDDVAVGLLAEPGSCLVGLSGLDGAGLWSAPYVLRNVTTLATLGDIDADGVRDFALGSFDNAVSAVSGGLGVILWRREGSPNNTGAMLDVAPLGDLDGNGGIDVVSASVDHQIYLLDGQMGHPLSIQDLRARGVAVAELPDGSGDGRQEFVAAGDGKLLVAGGESGTVLGPLVELMPPGTLAGETILQVYAYPTKPVVVMGSMGTGRLALPGYTGALGLELSTLVVLHFGVAPGAGVSGVLVQPFTAAFAGLTIHYQAATIFEPGHGLIVPVTSQVLPPY
ncbi:MAG TPA: FG-GAP-like repeat-containing protein, partial [Planctomycetota bacterium]|nr:FG-GAP-like repeat-containing protein [Planctomycetota bacterium]